MIYKLEINNSAKVGYTSNLESLINEYKQHYPDMKIEILEVDLMIDKIKENPEWTNVETARAIWKDLKEIYKDIQHHKHHKHH